VIERAITRELLAAAAEFPVVTVFGPRQAGKTTLVRTAFPGKPYFSLEYPDVRAAAAADPRGFLAEVPGGAVLDEVQRLPDLLSYIQGIVDEEGRPGMFVLTGSHQPRLHQAVGQTLAGRTAVLSLWPFSLAELRQYGKEWTAFDLVVRGFFPRVHEEDIEPHRFYGAYLQTYVERDVRALINLRDLSQFQQFLVLLAGRIGQVVNLTAIGNDVGVSATTIRNWLNVLKASFVVFELPSWSRNVRKRVVRSPKIYFTDVGLAAYLLRIRTADQAARDPLRGNLYENLVIADIVKGALNRGIRPELYFFRDSRGNEVDLLVRERGVLVPIEIKSAATFSTSFLRGIERFRALGIDDVAPGFVLYDGEPRFRVRGVRVLNPLHLEDPWETVTAPADGD